MDFPEYVACAKRTESIPPVLAIPAATLDAVFELCALAGQIADAYKKRIFYGRALDAEKVVTFSDRLATLASRFRASGLALGENGIDQTMQLEGRSVCEAAANIDIRLVHAAIGMYTEAGEMLEALRKFIATGQLDKINFAEELGDSDWYKAIAHDATGTDERVIRATNIEKLRKRYPDKFCASDAENRDLAGERQILEASAENDGAPDVDALLHLAAKFVPRPTDYARYSGLIGEEKRDAAAFWAGIKSLHKIGI